MHRALVAVTDQRVGLVAHGEAAGRNVSEVCRIAGLDAEARLGGNLAVPVDPGVPGDA